MESESQESELFHFVTDSVNDLLRSSEEKAQAETVEGLAWENAAQRHHWLSYTNGRRNSVLTMCHCPDLAYASDWLCRDGNLLQPIRRTTQVYSGVGNDT